MRSSRTIRYSAFRAADEHDQFWPKSSLEHVLKKLLDFSDVDMLHLIEFERYLFDHVTHVEDEPFRA